MKKLLLITTILIYSTVFAYDFYVSTDGSDAATGSKDRPVATLNKAIERAKKLVELRGYPNEGITIYLAEGVYQSDEAVLLDATLSGTEKSPLTIKPIDNAKVQIIGGRKFSLGDFSKVTDPKTYQRLHPEAADKVLVLDLAEFGISDFGRLPLLGHSMGYIESKTKYRRGEQAPELFFNEEPLTIARWPNEGFAEIKNIVEKGDIIRDWADDRKGQKEYVPLEDRNDPPVGFAFRFDKDILARWQSADDIRLFGYWFNNWSDQTVEVERIDAQEGVIYSRQPSTYGLKLGQRFYAYNLLEELDVPGEWYLDRSKSKLYFIPPREDVSSSVYLSLAKHDFVISDGASNVRIEDVEFGYTRANGIIVKDGENFHIINSRVANTGGAGIIVNGGKKHLVSGCEVFNNGTGGVRLQGGNVRALESAGHRIENCLIYNYARIAKTYNPGINLNGVGNYAVNNEIHTGDHMAISFGGNNHIIEYNHIYDVCRQTDDMAAIYAGRSWVSRGTQIRYNLIRDVTGYSSGTHKVSGVYMDDGISGITVEGNIFYNVAQGIFFNGGRDNTAVNNVFIDVENMMRSTNMRKAFTTWAAGSWKTLNASLKNYPIDKEPWKSAYPNLANMLSDEPDLPKYVTIKDNILYNTPIILSEKGIHDAVAEYGSVEKNIEIKYKPGRYNKATGKFEFDPDSGIFNLMPKLREIQPQKIGVLR